MKRKYTVTIELWGDDAGYCQVTRQGRNHQGGASQEKSGHTPWNSRA